MSPKAAVTAVVLNARPVPRAIELVSNIEAPTLPNIEPRFRLQTAAELMDLPPSRDVVKHTIPRNSIGAIIGQPGAAKSFLGFDLLHAISEGVLWFGIRTVQCPVLYIGLEGETGVARRAKALSIRHHSSLPNMRFLLTPLDIRRPDDCDDLIEAIRGSGFHSGLVCIDTLNRAAPGIDENTSQDMGQVIDALKYLQRELDSVVMVVHHLGKNTSLGPRGHSSLLAALDFCIEVLRDGEQRQWRLAKAKDAEDDGIHPFKLDVVELGEDEDGDLITSCTVRPDDWVPEVKRAKVPQGGNQQLVFSALGDLLKGSHQFGKAGAPAQRPCIELEAAVLAGAGRLTCASDKRTSRARLAISGLVSRGVLGLNEGWLWLH